MENLEENIGEKKWVEKQRNIDKGRQSEERGDGEIGGNGKWRSSRSMRRRAEEEEKEQEGGEGTGGEVWQEKEQKEVWEEEVDKV